MYDCPNKDKIGFINSIVCAKCGNVGHLERDCRVGGPGGPGVGGAGAIGPAAIDLEFENMMKDLNGESVTANMTTPAIGDGSASGGGYQAIEGAPQTTNQTQSPNVSSLPQIPTSGGYPTASSHQQAYTSHSHSQNQSHSQELAPNRYQDYNSESGGGYRNRQYDNNYNNSGRGYNNNNGSGYNSNGSNYNNNGYGSRERGGAGYGNSSVNERDRMRITQTKVDTDQDAEDTKITTTMEDIKDLMAMVGIKITKDRNLTLLLVGMIPVTVILVLDPRYTQVQAQDLVCILFILHLDQALRVV
ncbi:unnamed protein product [Ambrosiozyma monospora]|uniref:Unnamed protein product n=1 Tax=Ambrosiozyma monospora TaxID=43982 RepID=A0ACB5TV56_AMBMO|nr:unnamed protein product [Ambrosiozyma monospora]